MIELRRKDDYNEQQERTCRGSVMPCAVCGRAVQQPRYWLHLHAGGNHVVTEAEAAELDREDAQRGYCSDLGLYPLGPECYRRRPELRPYVQRWEGVSL